MANEFFSDLRLDVRKLIVQPLSHNGPPLARQLGKLPHAERPVPVSLREVHGHLRVEPHVLHQPDEHGRRPGVRAFQQEAVSARGGGGGQGEGLYCRVQCLCCHAAVGGPLAAGDGDKAGGSHVDDVVPHQLLGVLLVGVLDQRADTTPGGQNVASSN